MTENHVREQQIQQKEAELEAVIKTYYNYDMSTLKAEITRMLENETSQVNEEKKAKLQEIQKKFAKLDGLSADHVKRGSRHKGALQGAANENDIAADQKLLQDFETYGEQYEN